MKRFYNVQDLMHMPNADLAFFGASAWPNPPGGAVAQPVAGSATFTVTAPIHQLTGANTVTTIVPPYTGFIGKITVLAAAAMVFNPGGTAGSAIQAAVTAAAGRAYDCIYDGAVWWIK